MSVDEHHYYKNFGGKNYRKESKQIKTVCLLFQSVGRRKTIVRRESNGERIEQNGLSYTSVELKRQGNNLNQAVKNNYFGDITEQELLAVVDECKTIYRKLI